MVDSAGLVFLQPYWLGLLPVVWLIVWFLIRDQVVVSMWQQVCDPRFLKILTGSYLPENRSPRLRWLIAGLLSIMILGLARPSWQVKTIGYLEALSARVVILDLSLSMRAEDVKPFRLDRLITIAEEILTADFEGETGLIAFSGASFVVSPLTADHSTLLEFLASLSPEIMPIDGNRIDQALRQTQSMLDDAGISSGSIIVISDGVDRVDEALRIAKELALSRSRLSIIGLGTPQGAPVKNLKGKLLRDPNNNIVIAKPDFQILRSLADAGAGIFIQSDQFFDIEELSVNHNIVEQFADSATANQVRVDQGIWLVWLLIPGLLWWYRRGSLVWLVVFMLPVDKSAMAFEFNDLWFNNDQRAYYAFKEKQFEQVKNLTDQPELAASALYRLERYADAAQIWLKLDTASAHYNRANSLVMLADYEAAQNAYAAALSIDPDFISAEENLNNLNAFLQQQEQLNQGDNVNTDGEEGEDAFAENDAQSRIGEAGEAFDTRIAIDQPGFGDGFQQQLIELLEEEEFIDVEVVLEQFRQRVPQADNVNDVELIKIWAEAFAGDPGELFQRKFLREYTANLNRSR